MGACANCVDRDPCECAEFPNFKTLTQYQVSLIIGKVAMKSCPLGPAPTSVVLQVLDVLLRVITCMINKSFEAGVFAKEWRQAALVLPIEEVWSRHRVQIVSPSKQSPVCLQVI